MSKLLEPKVERPSQRERILRLLNDGPVCGTELLDEYIPRYSAVIWLLKRNGHKILTRKCQKHIHHSRQVEYVLEA